MSKEVQRDWKEPKGGPKGGKISPRTVEFFLGGGGPMGLGGANQCGNVFEFET